jgi:hypothetical protein
MISAARKTARTLDNALNEAVVLYRVRGT